MSKDETRDGVPDDISEEELDEYIDFLHDRIQFLEEELEDSEKTVLELQQEGQPVGEDPSGFLPVGRFAEWLKEHTELEEDRVERIHRSLERHPLTREGFQGQRSTAGLSSSLSELRSEIDEIRSDLQSRVDDMQEKVDRLDDAGSDNDSDDCSCSRNSRDSRYEEEKSLADRVAEYENSGGYGSSPGDHI